MPFVNRTIRSRYLRIAAVWFLVGLETAWTWFGEYHRHEEQGPTGGGVVIQAAPSHALDMTPRPLCLACQIGLERAASPAVGYRASSLARNDRAVSIPRIQPSSRLAFAVVSLRAPPAVYHLAPLT
jgi:hypothetical protein